MVCLYAVYTLYYYCWLLVELFKLSRPEILARNRLEIRNIIPPPPAGPRLRLLFYTRTRLQKGKLTNPIRSACIMRAKGGLD